MSPHLNIKCSIGARIFKILNQTSSTSPLRTFYSFRVIFVFSSSQNFKNHARKLELIFLKGAVSKMTDWKEMKK